MARKKKQLHRVGTTSEDKPVVAGAYQFTETQGLPLADLLHGLQEQDVVVDWLEYFESAKAAGMKPSRILSRLDEAVADVYGPAFRDMVVSRLRRVYDL